MWLLSDWEGAARNHTTAAPSFSCISTSTGPPPLLTVLPTRPPQPILKAQGAAVAAASTGPAPVVLQPLASKSSSASSACVPTALIQHYPVSFVYHYIQPIHCPLTSKVRLSCLCINNTYFTAQALAQVDVGWMGASWHEGQGTGVSTPAGTQLECTVPQPAADSCCRCRRQRDWPAAGTQEALQKMTLLYSNQHRRFHALWG
jgi:hypothetical protein